LPIPPSLSRLHSPKPVAQETKSSQEQTNKQASRRKKEKERKKWDLSEKDFVGEGAVHVGGVEEGDAGVDGVVDESYHVLFGLGRAIKGGHAHAAEALCGDLQSLRTQLYPPHYSSGLHFSPFYRLQLLACYYKMQKGRGQSTGSIHIVIKEK
jgi:hypothetical protein